MSGYTKLFESLLDSTIWQEPDNVRIVWITILAMKDQDGLVEASIPGLAHRARQSVDATEKALEVLLSPDPYSRTPDHEGRRIQAVDGGWVVLNADKYRDRGNDADRKQKSAERVARHRARKAEADRRAAERTADGVPVTLVTPVTRTVTPARASDTDTDPDRDALSGSPPSPPELPDLGRPSEQSAIPGALVSGVKGAIAAAGKPAPPALRDRRVKLAMDAWHYGALTHSQLKGEGIDPSAIGWGITPIGEPWDRCKARIDEVLATTGDPPNFAAAEEVIRRRIDVAAAEARNDPSPHLRWFIPMRIFDKDSFAIGAAMSVEQASRPRAGPRSASRPDPDPPPNRLNKLG